MTQIDTGRLDITDQQRLDVAGLARLLQNLTAQGYQLIGPTVADGAIGCDVIAGIDDLPAGWTETQTAGSYRLSRRPDEALFGYAVGATGFKRFLYPPEQALLQSALSGDKLQIVSVAAATQPPMALIGVRPCEAAALDIHDTVMTAGQFVDDGYAARRVAAFVVVADCTVPGGTCFCASLGTGPAVSGGSWDVALTEVIDGDEHFFVVRAGTEEGVRQLAAADAHAATPQQHQQAAERIEAARHRMGRELDVDGLEQVVLTRPESSRWDKVAERCLSCGNCTMVCPTCFCHTVVDVTDLEGGSERVRRWDSCFHQDFSYIHGGSVRSSVAARYRQWLTHKLGTWTQQFGTPGCVGCGRCISWCPVGIDITEEAAALRAEAMVAGDGGTA